MNRNVGTTEQIGSLVAGGVLLLCGVLRGRVVGALTALAGGALVIHGLSKHSRVYDALGIDSQPEGGFGHPLNRTVHVRDSIAINRPREEVFAYWKNLSNLPRFMMDIDEVTDLGGGRSRWTARGPFDQEVEWEAQIVEERDNELIKWETVESNSMVRHEGMISFESLPGQRGTVVRVDFRWSPPGGVLGAAAAKLLPQDPARRIREDLRRLRQLLEAGELARSTGMPLRHRLDSSPATSAPPRERALVGAGAGTGAGKKRAKTIDPVDEAGRESFPASDPPAFGR